MAYERDRPSHLKYLKHISYEQKWLLPQLSLEGRRQDDFQEIGNTQCWPKELKKKQTTSWKETGSPESDCHRVFFWMQFSFITFWWGRAWLVTEGEKMWWKSKPWKQPDNCFLFLKNIFLNSFWKIHEI